MRPLPHCSTSSFAAVSRHPTPWRLVEPGQHVVVRKCENVGNKYERNKTNTWFQNMVSNLRFPDWKLVFWMHVIYLHTQIAGIISQYSWILDIHLKNVTIAFDSSKWVFNKKQETQPNIMVDRRLTIWLAKISNDFGITEETTRSERSPK